MAKPINHKMLATTLQESVAKLDVDVAIDLGNTFQEWCDTYPRSARDLPPMLKSLMDAIGNGCADAIMAVFEEPTPEVCRICNDKPAGEDGVCDWEFCETSALEAEGKLEE